MSNAHTTTLLLHGLARTAASMEPMARALHEAGLPAVRINYPSRAAGIDALAAAVALRLPREGRLNMVGHSLGGILAKKLTLTLPPERRGRIVQIGSPNFGSALAERLDFLHPVLGPTLSQLGPDHPATREPGEEALEIGAIAGTAAIPSYGLLTGIEGENDGKVSVASAWGHVPEGCRIKLPVAHSTMMRSPAVIAAVIRFLKTGHF